MLLVLCVDLDDDIGRKTEFTTPVVGRDEVEAAATALATTDPEDSDVNVMFEGVHLHDRIDDEAVEVAVVSGTEAADVSATRRVGGQVDTVLAGLSTDEEVRALVVTDGAQDESVIPVIRSRVPIDGVRRVVVRQAQDLESMYYTIKQVLNDPETRGTILVPLGILLLIYPVAIIASWMNLPGAVFGVTSGLLGLYALFRGLGLEESVDNAVEKARRGLYAGRVRLITYIVATALLVIGGVAGVDTLTSAQEAEEGTLGAIRVLAALIYGAIPWFAAAGFTSIFGQITDEYLAGEFRWRYLNAPFYVLSIALVLHAVSAFFLGYASRSFLAVALTGGTLLAVLSTLAFAVVESRESRHAEPS
jgi:putative membrane protein